MMRSVVIVMLAGLAACSFNGSGDAEGPGVAGSGSGSSRTYAIADFSAVELSGADDVDVRVGGGFSVRAEGPAAELDKLRIVKDGSTLRVGRQRKNGMSWSKGSKAKIYVTLPRLAGAAVAGSGTMTVDRVEGTRFAGDIAGSGSLAIAAIAVDQADFSIAGSGDASATGSARGLKVDIAGSGSLEAGGLKATQAAVSIAGSGGVRARVDGAASVNMMGSGDVDLGSNAKCTVSKMGSGSVRCG